jgi:hypothetical protein
MRAGFLFRFTLRILTLSAENGCVQRGYFLPIGKCRLPYATYWFLNGQPDYAALRKAFLGIAAGKRVATW